jgi:peroxiredoxin
MPALEAGVKAPDISLPLLSGGHFNLKDALARGPVVAAFFKISCPVCQMTFPYVERLHQAYKGGKVTVVGVSQDAAADTKSFNQTYGVSFPTALDDTARYPVSNAYGLTNVPTIFYISQEGEIELSVVGWSKLDMEQLNAKLAKATGEKPAQLFHKGEQVKDFSAG